MRSVEASRVSADIEPLLEKAVSNLAHLVSKYLPPGRAEPDASRIVNGHRIIFLTKIEV